MTITQVQVIDGSNGIKTICADNKIKITDEYTYFGDHGLWSLDVNNEGSITTYVVKNAVISITREVTDK